MRPREAGVAMYDGNVGLGIPELRVARLPEPVGNSRQNGTGVGVRRLPGRAE